MSIPPLVCSTPPPPDQCEDDKDHEDFDLHYNLSQEDDYDYESFSTYNHFQSAISVNKPLSDPLSINNISNGDSTGTIKGTSDTETLQCTNNTIEKKLDHEQELINDQNVHKDLEIDLESKAAQEEEIKIVDSLSSEALHPDKKINNEEDLNIEDLNLTVEENSLNSIVKNELYGNNADSNKNDYSDKEKSPHIPDVMASIITSDLSETLLIDGITITPPSLYDVDNPPNSVDDLKMDDDKVTDYTDIKNEPLPDPSFDISELVETVQVTETFQEVFNEVNNETDDEFGDFNDFHTTSDTKAATIEPVLDACDNPWGNNQTDSDFGAFEAHFEETTNNEPPIFEDLKSVERSAPDNSMYHEDADDNDDFGDFDDFKSSAQETVNVDILEPLSRVPVLDFQKPESESQLLENINKILNTIFEEDVPEPESEFDGKLEAMLCETWGHLLQTDVRQPYIVNWNSSMGQKTLLKALCIDSRNILFGPKWSNNMPKYAANLSAAPLQPQKHTASGQNQTEPSSDKHPTKTPGTWSDPFTAEGQESCNKENTAAAPKRPTDLDVFDTPLSTKSDKLFSSTLDVQPIRQINLPDTHIFTPTDSETPRSKTIHYNGPPFLSQSSVDTDKNTTEEKKTETPADTKVVDDADYSDFQDFKGSFQIDAIEVKPTVLSSNRVEPPAHTNQMPSTSASYSVSILQPIKIEPIMPTLNWPSPGEVKETFDDFTEFASATTWNSDAQETTPTMNAVSIPQINETEIINNNSIKHEEPPSNINDSFDDDFDTFQSAVPSNEPAQVAPPISNFSNFVASDFSQTISTPVTSHSEPELDYVFPKIDIKSDPISFTKTIDVFNNSEPSMYSNNSASSVPKAKDAIVKESVPPQAPALSAVLQPTFSPAQTQQNSAQILQPLSLESFSQINWPNPGINLQDLSRFNPVETLNSLKSDLSVSGNSKGASPVHSQKVPVQNQLPEDDIWGDFVSSKPKPQQSLPKKATTFADDDEWTDFVSSPSVKPQNGLNTISLNVHTNLSIQKSTKQTKRNNQPLEIPITNYITPKSSNHNSYNDRHFQNL